MKKIILLILIITINISAQTFIVEKVFGDVQVLSGMSEKWTKVKVGQKLFANDVISTGENSFVQLNNNGIRFTLQSNSALGINYIKKLTLNELLLALAMEEVKNVPKSYNMKAKRNTAVYGNKIAEENLSQNIFTALGVKKLNGAKQLVNSGYKESGILLAKETYRKYPDTKLRIDDRLFFVDVIIDMGLLNEAATELNDIKKIGLSDNQNKKLEQRFLKIKEELTKK